MDRRKMKEDSHHSLVSNYSTKYNEGHPPKKFDPCFPKTSRSAVYALEPENPDKCPCGDEEIEKSDTKKLKGSSIPVRSKKYSPTSSYNMDARSKPEKDRGKKKFGSSTKIKEKKRSKSKLRGKAPFAKKYSEIGPTKTKETCVINCSEYNELLKNKEKKEKKTKSKEDLHQKKLHESPSKKKLCKKDTIKKLEQYLKKKGEALKKREEMLKQKEEDINKKEERAHPFGSTYMLEQPPETALEKEPNKKSNKKDTKKKKEKEQLLKEKDESLKEKDEILNIKEEYLKKKEENINNRKIRRLSSNILTYSESKMDEVWNTSAQRPENKIECPARIDCIRSKEMMARKVIPLSEDGWKMSSRMEERPESKVECAARSECIRTREMMQRKVIPLEGVRSREMVGKTERYPRKMRNPGMEEHPRINCSECVGNREMRKPELSQRKREEIGRVMRLMSTNMEKDHPVMTDRRVYKKKPAPRRPDEETRYFGERNGGLYDYTERPKLRKNIDVGNRYRSSRMEEDPGKLHQLTSDCKINKTKPAPRRLDEDTKYFNEKNQTARWYEVGEELPKKVGGSDKYKMMTRSLQSDDMDDPVYIVKPEDDPGNKKRTGREYNFMAIRPNRNTKSYCSIPSQCYIEEETVLSIKDLASCNPISQRPSKTSQRSDRFNFNLKKLSFYDLASCTSQISNAKPEKKKSVHPPENSQQFKSHRKPSEPEMISKNLYTPVPDPNEPYNVYRMPRKKNTEGMKKPQCACGKSNPESKPKFRSQPSEPEVNPEEKHGEKFWRKKPLCICPGLKKYPGPEDKPKFKSSKPEMIPEKKYSEKSLSGPIGDPYASYSTPSKWKIIEGGKKPLCICPGGKKYPEQKYKPQPSEPEIHEYAEKPHSRSRTDRNDDPYSSYENPNKLKKSRCTCTENTSKFKPSESEIPEYEKPQYRSSDYIDMDAPFIKSGPIRKNERKPISLTPSATSSQSIRSYENYPPVPKKHPKCSEICPPKKNQKNNDIKPKKSSTTSLEYKPSRVQEKRPKKYREPDSRSYISVDKISYGSLQNFDMKTSNAHKRSLDPDSILIKEKQSSFDSEKKRMMQRKPIDIGQEDKKRSDISFKNISTQVCEIDTEPVQYKTISTQYSDQTKNISLLRSSLINNEIGVGPREDPRRSRSPNNFSPQIGSPTYSSQLWNSIQAYPSKRAESSFIPVESSDFDPTRGYSSSNQMDYLQSSAIEPPKERTESNLQPIEPANAYHPRKIKQLSDPRMETSSPMDFWGTTIQEPPNKENESEPIPENTEPKKPPEPPKKPAESSKTKKPDEPKKKPPKPEENQSDFDEDEIIEPHKKQKDPKTSQKQKILDAKKQQMRRCLCTKYPDPPEIRIRCRPCDVMSSSRSSTGPVQKASKFFKNVEGLIKACTGLGSSSGSIPSDYCVIDQRKQAQRKCIQKRRTCDTIDRRIMSDLNQEIYMSDGDEQKSLMSSDCYKELSLSLSDQIPGDICCKPNKHDENLSEDEICLRPFSRKKDSNSSQIVVKNLCINVPSVDEPNMKYTVTIQGNKEKIIHSRSRRCCLSDRDSVMNMMKRCILSFFVTIAVIILLDSLGCLQSIFCRR